MQRSLIFCCVTILAIVLPLYPARADNELAVARPTFYVLAPGSDSAIGPIVASIVERLQQQVDARFGRKAVWIIPRVGWSPDDLYQQCVNDPTRSLPGGPRVFGGLILDGTNSYTTNTNSYLIWARGSVRVITHVSMVSCPASGSPIPTIAWVGDDINGYAARNGFPIEIGAATALYFGSAKNSNAASIALGAAIGGIDSTSAIPPVDPAHETESAATRAANDFMQKMLANCTSPDPGSTGLCIRLGFVPGAIPTPAPTPTPTPDASDQSATPSPSPSPSVRPSRHPQAKPTP